MMRGRGRGRNRREQPVAGAGRASHGGSGLVFPIGAGVCKRSYGTSVAETTFHKWHHEVGKPAILPPHPSYVQIPPSWLGDPNTQFRWYAITAKRQRKHPGSGESVTEYLVQWEDQDTTNDGDARPLPPEFDTIIRIIT
jgi:hypothetical protein